MKTIDIYLRVSKKRKDERYASLEGQETVCRGRVASVGAKLGVVHRDQGLSAWNPDVERPGWDALMLRLESGAADGVCVFDVERFSRQPDDGSRLIRVAKRGVVVLDADQTMDLTTPGGIKTFRDALSAGEYYSGKLSHRLTRDGNGKQMRALDGRPNTSSRPFGFEADGVTVRAAEAAALREVAELYVRGEPLDRLIAEFDSRGLLTSYGKPWTRTGVRRLLERPRNAGLVVYRGEVVSAMAGDPIIDRALYDRVIAVARSRRPARPASPRYLLSGVAKCCHCGAGLTGRPRGQLSPYADGSVRRQYWCAPSAGGCKRISIDTRWLDAHVLDWAMRELTDPQAAEAIEERSRVAEAERARLSAEIADIEATLRMLDERLSRRDMTRERYAATAGPLESQLRGLSDNLANVAVSPEPVTGRTPGERHERMIGWLEVASFGSVAEQRGMVLRALAGRRLVIGPGKPSVYSDRVTVG